MRSLNSRRQNLQILLPIGLIGILYYLPLLAVLLPQLSPASFLAVAGSVYYLKVLGFTLFQAALSAVAAVLLALPGAYLLSHFQFTGKKIVRTLTTLPFIMPSILVVLGFILFFGHNGFVNRVLMHIFSLTDPPLKILYSLKGIILAHVFYNLPIALRLITPYWSHLSDDQEQAAKGLGAGHFFTFRTITMPRLTPGILAAGSLIFLYCFMSFALILVLGGGPRFSTMEVEVYRLAKLSLDFPAAGALALAESFCTILILLIYLHFERKTASTETFDTPRVMRKLNTRRFRLLWYLYLAVLLIFVLGPLLSIVVQSFRIKGTRGGLEIWSFKSYASLFAATPDRQGGASVRQALSRSLLLGLGAVIFTVSAGLITAWLQVRRRHYGKQISETIFMLPMGISSVVIGFSYLFLDRYLPAFLSSSPLLIILAHSLAAFPLVYRSLTTSLRKIDLSIIEAGQGLGASDFRIFRTLEWPQLRGITASCAVLAFAVSMGEMKATMMLADHNWQTLPLTIYRLIGAYRFEQACVMGTILLLISFTAFLLIDRLQKKETSR